MGCLGNVIWFGIPIGRQCFKFTALTFSSWKRIGIPFGMQCFKIAKPALMPFGATVNEV